METGDKEVAAREGSLECTLEAMLTWTRIQSTVEVVEGSHLWQETASELPGPVGR